MGERRDADAAESWLCTVSAERIRAFAETTGDRAPIHVDPEAGRRAGYGGTIAHGLLTASLPFAHAGARLGARLETEALAATPGALSWSVALARVVRAGDTARVHCEREAASEGPRALVLRTTDPDDQTTSAGRLEWSGDAPPGAPPARLAGPVAPDADAPRPETWSAEALLRFGPSGAGRWRTLGAADRARFAAVLGGGSEEAFAGASPDAAATEPDPIRDAMHVFCLGFADFLDDFLALPWPAQGFAGHVGDAWRVWSTLEAGERFRAVYGPLELRASRSRRDRAVVRVGLRIEAEDGRCVLDGETRMLVPRGPDPLD